MTPTPLTFPGFDGPVDAWVEQRAGASRAVVVAADPDDPRATEQQRDALVEAGFIVAWLPAARLDATGGMPRVEDLAALLGALFVSSHATVGLVAGGRSCPVALATVEGAHDIVAAAVLVGATGDAVDATHEGLVPIVRLDTATEPAAVVRTLAQQLDAGAADIESRHG
jgi:hypothetical protein